VPMTPPPPPPPPPGPQPAPGPAVPGVSGTDLMNRLNKAYGVGADGALATLPTGIEGIFKEREEAERLAGVDKDFFKNEARNILDLRRELKADKKDAANMRLIEAGLRIMGGDSPYAFVNIGKGASEALKGFADDIKDIQKTKREYDKSGRELRTAEQLYARTQSDSALKTVEERRARNQEQQIKYAEAQNKLALDLANLDVRRQQVDVQRAATARPTGTEYEIRALSGEFGPNVRAAAEKKLTNRQELTQDQLLNRWNSMGFLEKNKLMKDGITFEQWANEQRRIAGTGGARGRVENGVYIPAGT